MRLHQLEQSDIALSQRSQQWPPTCLVILRHHWTKPTYCSGTHLYYTPERLYVPKILVICLYYHTFLGLVCRESINPLRLSREWSSDSTGAWGCMYQLRSHDHINHLKINCFAFVYQCVPITETEVAITIIHAKTFHFFVYLKACANYHHRHASLLTGKSNVIQSIVLLF